MTITSCLRGANVNKNDLINAVAQSCGLSKSDATQAVECMFSNITDTLRNGGEVRVSGFGTFAVSTRKASTGRNPRTGETIQIPETRQPKFRAGKTLKEAVN